MFYLDLNELDQIDKSSKLVGLNKTKLYSYFDSDHFEPNSSSTRIKLSQFLNKNGITEQPKTIMLLTNLRVLGYVFNPVSFYFCFDSNDYPLCAVAEVSNTFAEKRAYLVPIDVRENGSVTFCSRQKKEFYISPFSPIDLDLDFEISLPNKNVKIIVNDYEKDKCVFMSSLTGHKVNLSDSQILWLTITNPLITIRIILLIHWQALILFLKRFPFFAKEADPHKQKNVINPHKSLKSQANSRNEISERVVQ